MVKILPNIATKLDPWSQIEGTDLGIKKTRCDKFIPNDPVLCKCGKEITEHSIEQVITYFRDIRGVLKFEFSILTRRKKFPQACMKFDMKNGKNLKCACGRLFEQHQERSRNNYIFKEYSETTKWNIDTCTVDDGPTDARGDILFLGCSKKTSKYIRVSHATSVENLFKLLFGSKHWALSEPKLLISVCGGAHLNLKTSVRENFCQGLYKAAKSTNAWVISGGSYMGYSKLVGETFKENANSFENNRPVVLGVANWGTIRNKGALCSSSVKKKDYVEYELTNKLSGEEKSANLDPYHTHFIFVDDSKINSFGGEILMRSKLESALSQHVEKCGVKSMSSTPIVVLIIGGGRDTVRQVNESIRNNLPCVFIDDTGKFSNVFSYILKRIEKKERIFKEDNDFTEFFRAELKRQVIFELNREDVTTKIKFEDNQLEPIIDTIEDIFHPKNHHLLSFFRFDPNQNSNVDVAILKGLLKKIQFSMHNDHDDKLYRKQLELCLTWNRFDIAKEYILSDEQRDKLGSLDNFMFTAIMDNRPEFVKEFIETGFVIKNWLNYRKLLKLYNNMDKSLPFYHMLQKFEVHNMKLDKLEQSSLRSNHVKPYSGTEFSFNEIGYIIQSLIGDVYQHKFTQNAKFKKLSKHQTANILHNTDPFGVGIERTLGIFNSLDPSSEINIDKLCEYPEHELFIYCILLEKFELAKIFWQAGNNPICSALAASKILKSYADKSKHQKVNYNKRAEEFEKLACETLDICSTREEDQEKCQSLLANRVEEFGMKSPLEMAIAGFDLQFVAHSSCQSLITKLWYGVIMPDTGLITIFLSILCPLLAPLLVDFGQKQNNYDLTELDNNQIGLVKVQSKTRILKKIYYFCKSPYVKYVYHLLSHLLFLGLFSYVLLCEFYPVNAGRSPGALSVSIPEIILIFWVATLTLEELRKFLVNDVTVLKSKFKSYLRYNWNAIVLFAIVIYMIGLILRFTPDERCFSAARVLFAIDIIFWYLRTLSFYWSIRILGPLLVLMERMIVKLFYFLLVLVLIIFAFGVATQSLLYPNQKLEANLFKNIFFPTFYFLGNDYYTREQTMNAETCSSTADTSNRCPDLLGANVSLALNAVYLIVINLFLVNLLIAVFNNKFHKIEEETKNVWKFQRYSVAYEYAFKPMLPPPFIIISILIAVFRWLLESTLVRWFDDLSKNKIRVYQILKTFGFISDVELFKLMKKSFKITKTSEFTLTKWENYAANELMFRKNEAKLKLTENKQHDVLDKKIEHLSEKIMKIEETLSFFKNMSLGNQYPSNGNLLESLIMPVNYNMNNISKRKMQRDDKNLLKN